MKENSRLHGGGYILTTSLVWGLFPLVAVVGNGGDAPFGFMIAWGLGDATACLITLILLKQKVYTWTNLKSFFPSKHTFFAPLSEHNFQWNWLIIVALPRSLTVAFFAWSISLVPEVVATVLYYTWPAFFVLLLKILFSRDNQYSLNLRTMILFIFIFIGVAFVVRSITPDDSTGILELKVLLGIILLAISIGFAVMEAFFVRWADVVYKGTHRKNQELQESENKGGISNETDKSMLLEKTGYIILIRGVSGIVGSVIGFILAFSTGETLGLSDSVFVFFSVIGLAGIGHFTNAIGTLKGSNNSGIQAIRYTTPVFGVIFLWVFSYIEGIQGQYFILGLVAIVVGNLLVHFPTEDRFGLASLVVALWVSGVIVLFRESFIEDVLKIDKWLLSPESYFAVLALSATAFTLLLGFRINRLASRTAEEERLVFALLSKLDVIERNFALKLQTKLWEIDQARSSSYLRKIYDDTRYELRELQKHVAPGSWQESHLMETQAEIDALTHSKQYGREFGETTAVVFLGILTQIITLITRPPGEGLIGLIFDSFGFIFAGTMAFLTFHIFDLRRERSTSILERCQYKELGTLGYQEELDKRNQYYSVKFRQEGEKQEWRISVLCAFAIFFTVSILLWFEYGLP